MLEGEELGTQEKFKREGVRREKSLGKETQEEAGKEMSVCEAPS